MKKRILCCDDWIEILETLEESLKKHFPDSVIETCLSGIEAMAIIKEKPFDIIISDFDMKVIGGDGVSLFQFTEQNNMVLPFVLYTGHSESHFSNISSNRLYILNKGSSRFIVGSPVSRLI